MRRILSFLLPVLAQCGTVAGWGYRNAPGTLEAAPGQVLIVSVHGARVRLNEPVLGRPEPGKPWATVLAGLSAELLYGQGRATAGLFGVSQTLCPISSVPCEPVTNITLQIPFELLSSMNQISALEIKEGGAVLATIPVRPVPDQVHIIDSCDESTIYYSIFFGERLEHCTDAVIRPQGGLNRPALPFRPGQPVVVFAYGMGDAEPSPLSASFRGGLTKQPFVLRFALAGGPVYWAQAPDAVALTHANGTYQMYFTVPPLPPDVPVPACGDKGLYGNMSVTVSGLHSSDAFELCVAP